MGVRMRARVSAGMRVRVRVGVRMRASGEGEGGRRYERRGGKCHTSAETRALAGWRNIAS